MGGDGGSIPKRADMVKECVKTHIYEDPAATKINRWTNCTISETPLEFPIAVDYLGNLYSKTAVVDYLLQKKTMETKKNTHLLYSHLKSLKDIWEVKATEEDGQGKSKGSRNVDKSDTLGRRMHRFICPITQLPANSRFRFVVMRGCGCLLSQRAVDEVPSTTCINCQAPLIADSLESSDTPDKYKFAIPVNPEIEEQEKLRALFMRLKMLRKEASKSNGKKRKNTPVLAGPMTEEDAVGAGKQGSVKEERVGSEVKTSKKRKVKKLQQPNKKLPSDAWKKDDPRFKDEIFASMFMSDEEASKIKADAITTKPFAHIL
eukprot:gb/GEZN01011760.1/.p1 GENE.gb/GEZN01011760.1/~~gb/GEZN01011760.1/.p1  ORF type:complete len:318 (-),score=59.21 gb/GEZN01011760.1/:75-1028(-)